MRLLSWFVRLILFLLLVGLALNNLEPVTLNLLFGAQWQAPMIVIVLAVFVLGVVLGVVALLPSWMRHRRAGLKADKAQDSADSTAPPPRTQQPPAERPAAVIDETVDGV